MGDITITTTVHALTQKSHDKEELQEQMDRLGLDNMDEFIEMAETSVESHLHENAFEEDALELLEVTAEVEESDESA